MRLLTKSFGAIRTLFGAAAMLWAVPTAAQPTTISNTATAEWQVAGRNFQALSNRVDTIVTPPSPDQPTIVTYQLVGTGGNFAADLQPTQCASTTGPIFLRPDGVFAGLPTSPAQLRQTGQFRAGDIVVIGLLSSAANTNPAIRETVDVNLTLANGDAEQIRLVEDAPDSSLFIGMINTLGVPPPIAANDCQLSVTPGTSVRVTVAETGNATLIGNATIDFLVDPFGIVFDSGDGAPVTGVQVTIVDAITGQPAQVFGDDGVSIYPSTMFTGQSVTDSSGRVYNFPPGDYRFPFVAPGTYRLVVTPSAPFTAPSVVAPADLAAFRRPDDGLPFVINGSSYGQPFTLSTPEPVRVDIPIDQPGTPVTLRKTTSTQIAVAGDVVQYRIEVANRDARRTTGVVTLSDQLPTAMRLRPETVRVDGVAASASINPDGRSFSLQLSPLAPSERRLVTYLAEVLSTARPGTALNTARAVDNRGAASNIAEAVVAIKRDQLGDRMTIIGRITEGGCFADPRKAQGIGGVRVLLQDGTYTVTDPDGRYHFEGVRPGTHVVQIDPSTFPLDQKPVDCARSTRSAGSAISRFVEGRGGSLLRADFRAAAGTPRTDTAVARPARPAVAPEAVAAGADTNWFTDETPAPAWLFPAEDHNPRTKAIRIAVRHLPDQSVRLSINDKVVDALLSDGTSRSPGGRVSVSLWRGVPISDGTNHLVAEILNADGQVVETLRRSVHYSITPARAELVREQSVLVADGITRPVIAIRLTDRNGRPVKHGLTGDFAVPAPYLPAIEVEAQQVRQLAGLERAAPVWRVEGDNGMAYVELEPTTASGTLSIDFRFREDQSERRQTLQMWMEPGNQPWTVVGFASGTVGYNTLDDRMEPVAETLDSWNADARLALYAKGRVKGKWLLTLAYDSDKEPDDARFGGVIDPRAYYTIYADRAEQRHDAASVRKLYLRLERPQFYALFGDFETGLNETQLARYNRSLNGGKAEYRGRNLAATAFVADTPYRFRRDEIQGNGLSGPYQLGASVVLPNSERITIETRSRLRSEIIVDRKTLTRHIDYDIDYSLGTLRFREPILSRSSALDPQFIVAEYEIEGVGQRVLNAGGRASFTSDDESLRVGATLLQDDNGTAETNLAGVDLRYRPNLQTEIRAEIAGSESEGKAVGSPKTDATAWLVEVEHHNSALDLLAYAREQKSGFGVGQQNGAENGTRKLGVDARLHAGKRVAVTGSAWQQDQLGSGARRRAARVLAEYDGGTTRGRVGLIHADDRLSSGDRNRSTLLQLGVTQQLFSQKLELDAQTEFALGDDDASVDFPTTHRLGARWKLLPDVNLVGSYEIADGDTVRARTARLGFDLAPWAGGRLLATANQQDISEYGPRSFAAYGLAQSLKLSERLTVDLSVDGNRTLGGISAGDIVNPGQPVAVGGFLGNAGQITEDFVAISTGATYRDDIWTMTGRAEYRDGELANRYGVQIGALRQLGEGRALGALASWTKASGALGTASTESAQFELSWAHRPAESTLSWLNKTELRFDAVRNAVAGAPGPIGGPALTVSGNVESVRAINSLSVNWTPLADRGARRRPGSDARRWVEVGEFGFFWGTRYSSDRFGTDDVKGWSNLLGADARFTISDIADIGASASVRISTGGDTVSYAGGPTLTLAPFKNANLTLGYNFAGFRDRDFEAERFSRSGAYVTFKLKFDQTSFQALGL
ncbi:MAG: hypothetical protein H2056_08550 [Sphingopyxis sp.]|nr:hypothetical protein [Sphingopyxis sp.]